MFVSHDRYFIKKISDSILDFSDGKIIYYDYHYEEYLEKKKELGEEKIVENKEKKIKKVLPKKQKDNLDKQISKLEKEIEDLNKKLYLESVYLNPDKYEEVVEKINNLESKLDELLLK